MKDIIKLVIAIIFVFGSYKVGIYTAEDQLKSKLASCQDSLASQISKAKTLVDSIDHLNARIASSAFMKAQSIKPEAKHSSKSKRKN